MAGVQAETMGVGATYTADGHSARHDRLPTDPPEAGRTTEVGLCGLRTAQWGSAQLFALCPGMCGKLWAEVFGDFNVLPSGRYRKVMARPSVLVRARPL